MVILYTLSYDNFSTADRKHTKYRLNPTCYWFALKGLAKGNLRVLTKTNLRNWRSNSSQGSRKNKFTFLSLRFRSGQESRKLAYLVYFKECPSITRDFCSRSRHAKKITTGICLIFQGLFFSRNAEIGQKDHLWMDTKEQKAL